MHKKYESPRRSPRTMKEKGFKSYIYNLSSFYIGKLGNKSRKTRESLAPKGVKARTLGRGYLWVVIAAQQYEEW